MVDKVPLIGSDEAGGSHVESSKARPGVAKGKRWSEMTTSESEACSRRTAGRPQMRDHSVDSLSDSVSESDRPPAARSARPRSISDNTMQSGRQVLGRAASTDASEKEAAHSTGSDSDTR